MMVGESHLILIVDDDTHVVDILKWLLHEEGYRTICAGSGEEGLCRLEQQLPDLILLDVDMPGMNGFEFCRRVKSNPRTRLLPVVIVTGRSESEARLEAWNRDADDFLTKPFSRVEVAARCRALLRVKDLVDELDSAESVVFSLARAIEAKNRYTQGHSERVTENALALACQLGLSETDKTVLRKGATLHDLGKIAIPDEILNKPGPLTPAEIAIVREHPVAGVRIVEPLQSIRDAIPIIRWHHERTDGNGYPDGLKGDAIPLLARIVSVADVFDALSSTRPYRTAIPFADCLDMLTKIAASGGLDRELVRCFCTIPATVLNHKDTEAQRSNAERDIRRQGP